MRLAFLLVLAACTDTPDPVIPPPPAPLCVDGQCFSPPADQCERDRVVRYESIGVCEENGCVYPEWFVDCTVDGGWCSNGACQYVEECDCGLCDDPPTDTCQDVELLLVHDAVGLCDDSTCDCSYNATPQLCDHGCFDGGCNAPPGTALPDDACTNDATCGDAGTCVDDRCTCTVGTRDCVGGCCLITPTIDSFPGVSANAAKLVYGHDDSAIIALHQPAPDLGAGIHAVGIYRHDGTNQTLVLSPNRAEVSGNPNAFDLAFSRRAGLFVTTISSLDRARIFREQPYRRTLLGLASRMRSVAMTVDANDNIWMAYSAASDTEEQAYQVTDWNTAQFVPTEPLTNSRSLDLAAHPTNRTVHAFWQAPTDDAQAWQHTLLTPGTASSLCNKGNVEFDRDGIPWSVVPATDTTEARICRNGAFINVSDVTTTPAFPTDLTHIAFVLSRDNTAFIAFYDTETGAVHWSSSRDGERWTQGTSPVVYNTDTPGEVHVALARRRLGGVGLLAVPSDSTMGDALLMTL